MKRRVKENIRTSMLKKNKDLNNSNIQESMFLTVRGKQRRRKKRGGYNLKFSAAFGKGIRKLVLKKVTMETKARISLRLAMRKVGNQRYAHVRVAA